MGLNFDVELFEALSVVGQIVIDGLSKEYTNHGVRRSVVVDVSLQVSASEFVSIIGPSGCGKTTILQIVAGLLPPSSGAVSIDGHSPSAARRNRQIGVVFQDPTLLDWRTVLGNVLLPLDVLGVDHETKRQRGEGLLAVVGLSEFRNYFPDQISGGMRQRTAIARALSHDPAVLLMDEPFGALDLISRDHMAFELQRIWMADRKTILFVTHSIDEAIFLSDRVVILSGSPARVVAIASVTLPRPRRPSDRDTDEFRRQSHELRELLAMDRAP